jgi:hypothetical protein
MVKLGIDYIVRKVLDELTVKMLYMSYCLPLIFKESGREGFELDSG